MAGRTRRGYWIVATVVSAMLLVGAAVFAVTATADRNEAADARHSAELRLREKQAETKRWEGTARSQRTVAQGKSPVHDLMLSSLTGATGVLSKLLEEGRTSQGLGAADQLSPADYNASVARANALRSELNAQLEPLRRQLPGNG